MRRKPVMRPLAFEQLETKALPSSLVLLLASSGEGPRGETSVQSVHPGAAAVERTESVLRYIAAHTRSSTPADRPAAAPTAVACAAADQMLAEMTTPWDSFFAADFSDSPTEL